MKKILYIENEATARSVSFYKAALMASKQMGWEFHLAYNCIDYSEEKIDEIEKELGLHFHQIDFIRNPMHPGNIRAYLQLCALMDEENFDLIHCNTPIGGVLGRIVAKRNRIKNVIYQAHGFHFYKGAPIQNWLVYYPIEKMLAKITDSIITINEDDYEYAQEHLHPKKKIYYVPGVGIELDQWDSYKNIRNELGFTKDDIIVLVVGRLEKNKNCGTIIDAISRIKDEKIKLVFCGEGNESTLLQKKANELGVINRIFFLGNRNDMSNVYHMADCFVLASYREGLSRSVMEAMACGLPCIVSNIRGNKDLIDTEGGYLFMPSEAKELEECIHHLFESKDVLQKQREHNLRKIQQFSLDNVIKILIQIYEELNI